MSPCRRRRDFGIPSAAGAARRDGRSRAAGPDTPHAAHHGASPRLGKKENGENIMMRSLNMGTTHGRCFGHMLDTASVNQHSSRLRIAMLQLLSVLQPRGTEPACHTSAEVIRHVACVLVSRNSRVLSCLPITAADFADTCGNSGYASDPMRIDQHSDRSGEPMNC
jgi:hypothetical protein